VGKSSTLRVGDLILTIGNPLGMGISAKEGIVSRQGVSIDVSSEQTLYDLIEISAAINPGNSGGPLVNMAGEVVGITSVKIASEGVEGMGYALSIDSVLPIIQKLITSGSVIYPWLGITFSTVTAAVAQRNNLPVNSGILISQVAANSPASKAGLKAGDIIVNFAGKPITNTNDLVKAIRSSQVGQIVDIIYWRGTQQFTTQATLERNPNQ